MMKKLIMILLIAMVSLMAVSCDNKNLQGPDEINQLSKTEIKNKYNEAVKLYSWFEIGTLPADLDEKKVIGDDTYFKVTGEVTDYDVLVKRLESVFDESIVKKLLAKDLYKAIDGELYGVLADRGTDISLGAEEHKINKKNDQVIQYEVCVDLLDSEGQVEGSKTYTFTLKRYDDGIWRFDDFFIFR